MNEHGPLLHSDYIVIVVIWTWRLILLLTGTLKMSEKSLCKLIVNGRCLSKTDYKPLSS
jgi:hypothetical protein